MLDHAAKKYRRSRKTIFDMSMSHVCSYCGATESPSWRRGKDFDSVPMCVLYNDRMLNNDRILEN
jgi:hypothetical protein